MDLNGKCVLLGVSGGIAAYKMANVASALRKLGADVEVIMTRNATQFITPSPLRPSPATNAWWIPLTAISSLKSPISRWPKRQM